MDALALLLADSRFPSGSYAHSLGLEQAVADGLTDVPAFMAARSRLVAEIDARFAVEACNVARRSTGPASGRRETPRRAWPEPAAGGRNLSFVNAQWYARCPSPVLREAARRLGAQLLRSAAVVWPVSAPAGTPRAVALGVVAAAAGLGDEDVALLALYDDAATVASAALKLLPLDPAVTARWLAELAPRLALAARAVAADERALEDLPAPAAVAVELAAPVHQQARERLFAS
jgi:urease accessory protein